MSDFPFPTAADPWLLWEGDCLLGMAELPEHSVDAVVTDPPYFLGFMGKEWDGTGAKPMDFYEFTLAWARCAYRVMKPGAHLVAFASSRTYHRMACGIEDAGFEIRDQLMWLYGSGMPKNNDTCLKPAHEPVVLARKPPQGSITANAERWGTGLLGIEACRLREQGPPRTTHKNGSTKAKSIYGTDVDNETRLRDLSPAPEGRFPANVLLDEDAALLLDEQAPNVGAVSPVRGTEDSSPTKDVYRPRERIAGVFHGDRGGASRFLYCSKASKKERGGSVHPTVKPLDVMRWLCRLVTPPGGLVLDPFAGTGTTGQAAIEEGFRVILCEQEPQYVADINRRLTAKATA